MTVPEDFTIPEVTDEQMQQMRQKQMQQMPQGAQPGVPGGLDEDETPPPAKTDKKDAKKPEPKKK